MTNILSGWPRIILKLLGSLKIVFPWDHYEQNSNRTELKILNKNV